MNPIIEQIEKESMKSNITPFNIGDTVKVYVKVVEGDKERIQAYEGIVTSRRGGSVSETFTVRKISYGVGVDRIFPIHSPKIAKITVVKKGKNR